MQIYYTIPAFVDAIFSAKVDEDVLKASPSKEEKKVDDGVSEQVEKRINESKKLIFEMKKLFATLTCSDKKYADPSGVLHSIVDDDGNRI